jgi:hypothetical protein
MRITFFKTPKPKGFNYIPRYYNEQKEEFNERQKRIEAEMGINQPTDVGYRSRLKQGAMSEKLMSRRKTNRASTLRLLIIIAILTILALYLLRDFGSLNFLTK